MEGAGPGEAHCTSALTELPRSRLAGGDLCARRLISWAARRVNVSIRMRAGSTPWIARCATRYASVLVLPVPAPATISSGPRRRRPCPAPACRTWPRGGLCGFSASNAEVVFAFIISKTIPVNCMDIQITLGVTTISRIEDRALGAATRGDRSHRPAFQGRQELLERRRAIAAKYATRSASSMNRAARAQHRRVRPPPAARSDDSGAGCAMKRRTISRVRRGTRFAPPGRRDRRVRLQGSARALRANFLRRCTSGLRRAGRARVAQSRRSSLRSTASTKLDPPLPAPRTALP